MGRNNDQEQSDGGRFSFRFFFQSPVKGLLLRHKAQNRRNFTLKRAPKSNTSSWQGASCARVLVLCMQHNESEKWAFPTRAQEGRYEIFFVIHIRLRGDVCAPRMESLFRSATQEKLF